MPFPTPNLNRPDKSLLIKRRLYPKRKGRLWKYPGTTPSVTIRDYFFKRQLLILLTPAAALFSLFGKYHPDWVENIYSRKIYPILSQSIGYLSSLVPFSLAECVIVGLILLGIYLTAALIRRLIRNDGNYPRSWYIVRFLSTVLSIASVIYALFVLNCGLNYSRYPFTYYSGLTVRDSTPQELAELCTELIGEANALREQVQEDSAGVTTLSKPIYETAADARTAFDALSGGYVVLGGHYAQPKPVVMSRFMSQIQITGVFFPLTFEANINREAPEYTIPATMCHELAHLRGFMREDEANFIGYLACRCSDNSDFQYSGVMLALVYSMNSLYGSDPEAYFPLVQMYSQGVAADFQYNNRYWQQFEGPVAEVSNIINDSYLKANFQNDGVQSYGRMVDLLLADYRKRHELV